MTCTQVRVLCVRRGLPTLCHFALIIFCRRPCARRKCTENLPEDRAQRPALCLRHLLRVLCPTRIHGRQVRIWKGLQLVLELDLYRRSFDLVRHLVHVYPLLQGHEGARL